MKRFCLILVTMLVTMASHAQFEAGKYYVGSSDLCFALQFRIQLQRFAGRFFWSASPRWLSL